MGRAVGREAGGSPYLRLSSSLAVVCAAGGLASSAGDAIANGVALRTTGLLARWQERLADYPEELAAARIEDAALTWGGFTLRDCSPSLVPESGSHSAFGNVTRRATFGVRIVVAR